MLATPSDPGTRRVVSPFATKRAFKVKTLYKKSSSDVSEEVRCRIVKSCSYGRGYPGYRDQGRDDLVEGYIDRDRRVEDWTSE